MAGTTLRLLAVCSAAVVLAIATSQGVNAQDQVLSTIMYQNYNYTTKSVGYSICDTKNPIVGVVPANMSDNVMTQVDQATALGTTIDAKWFGGETGPASNFQVVSNCSVLQLTSNGGHGTTFYTGPVPLAPNGCSASWYRSPNYLTLFVNITNTGYAWSVSLPTNTSYRAQTSCNGGYQFCPLAVGLTCDDLLGLATTLKADGSPSPQAAAAARQTVLG